ncbi:MAG: MarR family transcriptional regulator [Phycisphaeraceae bacterium]|nr:MAG: MarR family transcriptional regulator [Phycisphaeraceae bacterium]
MPDNSEALLRAVLSVTARQTFPPDKLAEIVLSKGAGTKQLSAFNLCDGTKAQGEIAKALKLDPGNFSKTVGRWIDSGIVFRLGEGRDAKLLHVYPLNGDATKKKGTSK